MGILYIVATPIGNREDLSPRAKRILESVAVVLCEDTRHTGLLIKNRLMSYYEEIEDRRIPEVLEILKTDDVALVSDAGTPLISDPGYRLVRECIKKGIHVISIPGPSAVLTALTSSGLPPDKFLFLGFFDKKKLNDLRSGVTTIFYSAPHKLQRDLSEIEAKFGDIDVVIARELTKIHEEIWRGTISEAQKYFVSPKGELVLLFNIPQA